MATLKSEFVNCWTLLTEKGETPQGQLLMRRVRERYRFPVDSMIFTPDAEWVTAQNANVMKEHPDRKAEQYHEFLTGALDLYRAKSSGGASASSGPPAPSK
jgi:hypothetical protein